MEEKVIDIYEMVFIVVSFFFRENLVILDSIQVFNALDADLKDLEQPNIFLSKNEWKKWMEGIIYQDKYINLKNLLKEKGVF